MNRSHRIQLDPTASQAIYFARACGTARMVWNWALAEWESQRAAGGKPKASELKRQFNALKYERFPWMKSIHRDAHGQPFANLQTAFGRFFDGEAKRPTFKKKGRARDSFYVANDRLGISSAGVRLPVVGFVRMVEPLRFAGKIMSATVSRDVDRWFVSFSADLPDPTPVRPAGEPVGVDLGLTTFATLSTGEKVVAPKPLAKAQRKLRRLNRSLHRKVKGSANRKKAAVRVAKCHRRVRNVRADFVHKLTTRLAKNHGWVAVESLNVAGMVKNRSLSRAISDAGWGEFRRQLVYKCPLYGSELVVADRFFPSSKICSACGEKVAALPLSVRTWACPACGVEHDRDVNAAVNLNHLATRGYRGSDARGDCGSGPAATPGETEVDETGTTTGVGSCRLTP